MALPVPEPTATAIHEALAAHRRRHPGARWLAPALYHVTLRFLGPVDAGSVPRLAAAIEACAEEGRPFRLAIDGTGGTRGRSEVAWLSLAQGSEDVVRLADRLDALLPQDLRSVLRPGRPAPHLTIARRAPADLVTALAASDRGGTDRGGIELSWVVDQVVLFRSHTGTPAGSRYEAIAQARLRSDAAA